ncbi:MAG: nucleoside monophosphate kinase [Erysipelotrichaceae bacterium]|nr:nucleoside monophosphate kinase [Erysipelotrichaceae bacterium]
MKNIILYGAPAAGKGTQCELLVREYGYKHISMGQLFRDLDDSTELNREIHEKISKGILIDDETTAKLLQAKLKELGNTAVVLDGFPRTLNQAKILDKFFSNYVVINIEVEEQVALERTLGRVSCPKCGKIYNKYSEMKPKNANLCDNCNVELQGRSDDNEESFKVRFNTYLNNVQGLLDYYRNQNCLYIIKSHDKKEDTFADVKNILDSQD